MRWMLPAKPCCATISVKGAEVIKTILDFANGISYEHAKLHYEIIFIID